MGLLITGFRALEVPDGDGDVRKTLGAAIVVVVAKIALELNSAEPLQLLNSDLLCFI